MQAFVRVVETGSFSLAARQLHLGQPAVWKMVAQLDERLGGRLLLRSTQGLFPTAAGQNFYDRAKRIVEEADEAEATTRNANASLSVSCASAPQSRLPSCTSYLNSLHFSRSILLSRWKSCSMIETSI
jgi:DNA-binding transcriptional LysR family regulator